MNVDEFRRNQTYLADLSNSLRNCTFNSYDALSSLSNFSDEFTSFKNSLLESNLYRDMTRVKKHPAFDPNLIWEFFNQTDYWLTAQQNKIQLEDITDDHLINLIAWAKDKEDSFRKIFAEAKSIGAVPPDTRIYSLSDFPLWKQVNRVAQNRGLTNLI